MRVAPIGLALEEPFELAAGAARVTHGHPSGFLAAGVFAEMVARLRRGEAFDEAANDAVLRLSTEPGHGEVRNAVVRALELAMGKAPRSAETVETLGAGWVAEEALAIAVYCAAVALDAGTPAGGGPLDVRLLDGLALAVNHSGDSDSTGSLTGNLLGAALGPNAIPGEQLDQLELGPTICRIANDLTLAFLAPDLAPGWEERYRSRSRE